VGGLDTQGCCQESPDSGWPIGGACFSRHDESEPQCREHDRNAQSKSTTRSACAMMAKLLTLPVELRHQIYTLVLPYTTTTPASTVRLSPLPSASEHHLTLVRQDNPDAAHLLRINSSTGSDIVWHRGCTAILAACRQIHEEAADLLYGDNTFVIDVTFEAITFRYRWQTHNGLVPSRGYSFLEHFSQRNLLRVRKYVVGVESVDDYTGMIKYNVGGRGLPAGIKAKVRDLVQQLTAAPWLQCLQVHLINKVRSRSGRVSRVHDEAKYVQTQTVLEPFRALSGVRRAQFSGISKAYAEELSRSMTAQRGT
jgi:hypothetical protein